MKRSEMINLIQELLNANGMNGLSTGPNEVLTLIGEAGMQPPAIKEPCETFVLHNGQYIKTEDSFIFTHKWDAE